ncbi:MAG: hypothetical protein R2715_16380 [Ilumatobacteraceae bacterium]
MELRRDQADDQQRELPRSQTIANAVVSGVGETGLVCISPSASTHIIVDRTAILGLQGSGDLTSTGSAAVDWALTQVGSPYAAINPYRFGDSKYGEPWTCESGVDECTLKDMNGRYRTVEAGDFVYDCSGLVVAAWLRAGVDLVRQGRRGPSRCSPSSPT